MKKSSQPNALMIRARTHTRSATDMKDIDTIVEHTACSSGPRFATMLAVIPIEYYRRTSLS